MERFDFDTADLFDADKMMTKTTQHISQGIPGGAANLKTSRHIDKRGNPLNVTMFSLSEILMKIPSFDSVGDTLSRFEAIVSGTIGGIYDDIKGVPGLSSLIPADIRAKLDSLNIEPKDKETSEATPAATDAAPAATGSAAAVITTAKAEVGYTESRNNVNKYAPMAGVANGQLWCATFLVAMFNKAGVPQGKLLTPSTRATWTNYSKLGMTGSEPKVGALIFFDWGTSKPVPAGIQHIGLVVSWDAQYVTTIEGNTSPTSKGSQSNGDGVWEKRRSRSNSIAGYAYPAYTEETTTDTTTTTTTGPAGTFRQ